jgi:hypothetical protein
MLLLPRVLVRGRAHVAGLWMVLTTDQRVNGPLVPEAIHI